MFRQTVWLCVIIILSACGKSEQQAPAPGSTNALATAQKSLVKEVMIASKPGEATIVIGASVVGETPMKLLISGNTNIVLKKEGYVRQAIMVNQKTGPNLVVSLIPEEVSEDPESAPAPTRSRGYARKTTPSQKKATEDTPSSPAPEAQRREPAPAQPKPAVTPAARANTYDTMQELKVAMSAGTIDRNQYRVHQGKIRAKRAAELEELKRDYRERKISKDEYNTRAREIRVKYEGR